MSTGCVCCFGSLGCVAGAVWAALRADRQSPSSKADASAERVVDPPSKWQATSTSSSSLSDHAKKKLVAATNASRDLYDAAWIGDFEGAFKALEQGADPYRCFGARKISTLHVAARTGNTPVMQMLLAREGAQLEIQNKDGETPLFGAVMEGHVSTTQLLVDAKADVNARDSFGRTVLAIARARGKTDFVEFLTARGAID
mmetsp:Transcript_51522/g.95312  ORF Transcript_51522/g.95312 Transcript_51522/m.95312 type:complete len:200 (-) Transcript_51522:39-638(-)